VTTLRPYQKQLVADVIATFRSDHRTAVLQSGTGSGKTHTAAAIIAYATGRGHSVLFLAHLDDLITDTAARLAAQGIRAGFVQAGRPTDPAARVQVASLQTLHARGLLPPADFIILDECHRAMGSSVRAILAAYPDAWLLGLTATPQRGDAKPLGDVFSALISGPSNEWLVSQGYLVPCEVLAPGAYNDRALVDCPVAAYDRHTPGRRAIVFAASVSHARALAAKFGTRAGLILGTTPRAERERLKAAVVAGSLHVLVVVGVGVEGFDLPALEVVILARPFSVTGSFLQAIGRGRRPSPGKTTCTVIDLRGAVHLHGLPDDLRVWSLDGKAVRMADAAVPLRRCKECLAVFRVARVCPRCGATHSSVERIARVLSRAEKLERMGDLSPQERDRRALYGLMARLRRIPKYAGADESRLMRVATFLFEKSRKRKVAA
jgi:DNA repair protein RadD